MDFGFHPPTVYFPLVVEEALMIEPTETESVDTLDSFVGAMRAIAEEVETNPEVVISAPHVTPVGRVDEARAARQPDLRRPDTAGSKILPSQRFAMLLDSTISCPARACSRGRAAGGEDS